MTDLGVAGHTEEMHLATVAETEENVDLGFEEIYSAHFDFIWCALRRLGVPHASVDDAVQDVFLVVVRKLDRFEGRASIKTWLYGIALRVARDHRRSAHRKGGHEALPDTYPDRSARGPLEDTARREAARILDALLDRLDDHKREVFVFAEIEQLSSPEIAELLGIKLNTVYSRLRAARRDFERNLTRFRAKEEAER